MAEKSIYKRIAEYIASEGALPADFVAEEKEYKADELRFAPGTLEGVLGHHLTAEGEIGDYLEKIKGYQFISPQDAMYVFETLEADDFKTASLRAAIRRGINGNRNEYDPGKLADVGACFIEWGTKVETVKLGLVLLSLFDWSSNEKMKEMIKTLGYCEEFTYYAMEHAQHWDENERQTYYFDLAQKLKGWGKINAVDKLKGDTVKKQKWILSYGCENTIRCAYSARTCVDQCDMYNRMKNDTLSAEEFKGACTIMKGLLDEGIRPGLSTVESPVEFTLAYIAQCKDRELDVELVSLLACLDTYFQSDKYENADKISEAIKELLSSLDMKAYLMENLEAHAHKCIQIANIYDVDMTEQIIELIDKDFEKYYTLCYSLFAKDAYLDRFFEICDREVKEELYEKGMGNAVGLGTMAPGTVKLDMIVQFIGKYPLQGKKMVIICMQSPITRWRNVAAKALITWTNITEKSLSKLDSQLYALLKDVINKECNDKTKDMWKKLI